MATGPSLARSLHDSGALRTVLLALAGVALIAWGAFRHDGQRLLAGILVLVPALLLKILPGLADLGVPRFVWFGLCGALLAAAAIALQRRTPKT